MFFVKEKNLTEFVFKIMKENVMKCAGKGDGWHTRCQ